MQTRLAVMLLLASLALTQDVIYSGAGFGTYYYDVVETEACRNSFQNMDNGLVECSLEQPWTLNDIGSNYVVAMNDTLLKENMGRYCGKRAIVFMNGVPSRLPFFVGDGCHRCGTRPADRDTWNPDGAPGLDFSFSALRGLSSEICENGHVDISWKVINEQIYDFAMTGFSLTNSWARTPRKDPIPTASAAGSITTDKSTPTMCSRTTLSSASLLTSSGNLMVGSWKCNGAIIEEYFRNAWMPIATCGPGMTCLGAPTVPHCGPAP